MVPANLVLELAKMNNKFTLLKRIPKSARSVTAENLAIRIENALVLSSAGAWWDLLAFAYGALKVPVKSKPKNTSIVTEIRTQLSQIPVRCSFSLNHASNFSGNDHREGCSPDKILP